jgi:hypothetical protein
MVKRFASWAWALAEKVRRRRRVLIRSDCLWLRHLEGIEVTRES